MTISRVKICTSHNQQFRTVSLALNTNATKRLLLTLTSLSKVFTTKVSIPPPRKKSGSAGLEPATRRKRRLLYQLSYNPPLSFRSFLSFSCLPKEQGILHGGFVRTRHNLCQITALCERNVAGFGGSRKSAGLLETTAL